MVRTVGTVIRGLRAPIVKEGDDLAQIVLDTVLNASQSEGFELRNRDIVAITESILARTQGNFASLDVVAEAIKDYFGHETVGVLFPILSRNRFYPILKGIARGAKKVVIQLGYPSDEVGNQLVSDEQLEQADVNPWQDILTEADFYQHFSHSTHPFTGQDYIALYRECVEAEGAECEILFANRPTAILDQTDHVLVCSTHNRKQLQKRLDQAGATKTGCLDDILTQSIDGSGYNETYGLLGANLSNDNVLKLFPRQAQSFVDNLQELIIQQTGKRVEVMIYGDGAFKDPTGRIWELADPVVSPGFTRGLAGTPDEVKLKYLADGRYADLSGEELNQVLKDYIQNHDHEDSGDLASSLGTTPRKISDLVGSLADLTSGSGDKGTPFVYIQGYFDNYAVED